MKKATSSIVAQRNLWEDYVPLIKSGQHTDVYLTATIETAEEYAELCYRLENAFESETFTLHINNGGGYVDSAFMIIDSIKNSKAKVTAKLSGTVASAATVIALSCHEVECANYLSFMIHNYSGGAQGKGHEMKAQMEFVDSELNNAFKTIYGGFLTTKEMEAVIEGGDCWLNKKEVNGRLKARANKDLKTLEEIAVTKEKKYKR